MIQFVDHLKRFSQLFKQLLDAPYGAALSLCWARAELANDINPNPSLDRVTYCDWKTF